MPVEASDSTCLTAQNALQLEDKRQAIADEMAVLQQFCSRWSNHLLRVLGLAKKCETIPSRHAFDCGPLAPGWRGFVSVGTEVRIDHRSRS